MVMLPPFTFRIMITLAWVFIVIHEWSVLGGKAMMMFMWSNLSVVPRDGECVCVCVSVSVCECVRASLVTSGNTIC